MTNQDPTNPTDPRIEAMIRHDMENSLSVTAWTFEEWRDKRPRAYAIRAADTERLLAAADLVDPARQALAELRAAVAKFEDHLPVPSNKRGGAPDSYDRGYSEACDDFYEAFKPVAALLAGLEVTPNG